MGIWIYYSLITHPKFQPSHLYTTKDKVVAMMMRSSPHYSCLQNIKFIKIGATWQKFSPKTNMCFSLFLKTTKGNKCGGQQVQKVGMVGKPKGGGNYGTKVVIWHGDGSLGAYEHGHVWESMI
jgi:hypothetical protein